MGTQRRALGEPVDGFPSWYERAVHVWTNRARADPAADLASCSACGEEACYGPAPPVVWNHDLARAARFHSDNLVRGSCGLQHDSPCALVSGLSAAYTPGPCDGAPSCACQGGAASCGSTGTAWSARVAAFGTSPNAENIARGYDDPLSTFYLWLHEPDSDTACGFRIANGHRYNILTASRRALGVGKSSSTYTQDFSGTGSPDGLVGGVHYPLTGATLSFRANWYRANAPTTAYVNVEGACHPMSLERGTTANGTYLFTLANVPNTCVRYYFHFIDASGDSYFPTVGSFGINCGAADWENSRAPACDSCTPSCAGRECGGDGCGGSCGSCADGETCDASGQCRATPGGGDAGVLDAGAADAAASDASSPDAAPADAAPADAAPDAASFEDAAAEPRTDLGVADADGGSAGALDAEAEDAGAHTVPPRPGADATAPAVRADAGPGAADPGAGCSAAPGSASADSTLALGLLLLLLRGARRRAGAG